jgi:Ca2+-binding EF-hand superfamily protein
MRTNFVCAAAVLAGFWGTAALAADAPKPLSPASQTLSDRMKTADTDHDGNVTKAEWQAFLKARFASFDKNNDGKLDAGEVTAMMATQPNPNNMTAADYIKPADKDGDGMISWQEYLDRSMGRFDAWDLNHDGTVSADELKAEITRMEATPR